MRSAKRVLFMGEAIADVYHYGRLMNRPAKEPIQCIHWERSETFEGGVYATAKHASALGAIVEVMSEVEIAKVRFLESSHNRKLFEYYGEPVRRECNGLHGDLDIIAVCDYGHGMMTPDRIGWFQQQPVFKAACVQTNAGNYGFNLATKYRKLDYLCVDEQEARLATKNQHGDLRQSLQDLAIVARTVVITLGARGAIGKRDGDYAEEPARTTLVRDTMGAGDAFFAVTTLFADDMALPALLRLGNAAAAVKTQNVGQKPITIEQVEAMLETA